MRKEKKRVRHPLLLGMVLYAVVILAAAAFGLRWLWNYMEAYENTRPEHTITAYMEQLTDAHICESAAELVDSIDHNLQSREECLEKIGDVLSGGITYAKKTSASTDTTTVYVLRCGSRVIGSVEMSVVEVDDYGFSHWAVTGESFDFSFLIGKGAAVTVPEEFTVTFNGTVLDERYITEQGILYENLEDFYDFYALPTIVTYEVPAILGEGELTVTDREGDPVEITADTDYNVFLSNCSDEEIGELDPFVDAFLTRYVAFTGSAFKSSETNYKKLVEYVLKDSDLHTRMQLALDGLAWAQSWGDKLVSVTVNQYIGIGDGRYICDATYLVDTTGKEGVVQTTNNARFVIVETESGYKVERLISY